MHFGAKGEPVRQQLIFELRPSIRMRQQSVKSRTVRQMAGDLSDLEGELAKTNTSLFRRTGLSWARPDIEGVWSRWGRLDALANGVVEEDDITKVWEQTKTLPRNRFRLADRFPDETHKIDRLINERRLLLGRMAVYDKGVEQELQLWPQQTPGLFQGPGIDWDDIPNFNPWTYLDTVKFPFPDPFFFDSLFGPDVDWDADVTRTPQYEAVFPWFFNDVEEDMVAQLDADLRDTIPWDGSAQAWMIRTDRRKIHPKSAFGKVLRRVQSARHRRELFAKEVRDKEFVGDQLPLFGGNQDAVQVPGDFRHTERGEVEADRLRAAAAQCDVLVTGPGR